ncbi:MAG TPA: hypothetical protein VMT86_08680 [Bryobacteraceae bacterium]|nr:hypothetical protein [Bryobacteraceae bacterium]
MSGAVSLLRRALPFLAVVLAVAVLYDAWVFYSRWSSRQEGERTQRAAEVERARQSVQLFGGTDFRILSFYAVPNAIRRGDHARLCYGVYRAQSVRIEPPVEKLSPSPTYCFDVRPRQSTTYKLIAEDGQGHTAAQEVGIRVVR